MTRKKAIVFFTCSALSTCFLLFFIPLSHSQEVYLKVSNGAGAPDSKNVRLEVSMSNSVNRIKGVQLEICDTGNYLSCTDCEAIGRASGLDCSAYENKRTGCAKLVLYSLGTLIDIGEGPIALFSFDVSENAPSGECVSLIPNIGADPKKGRSGSRVSDESNNPLDVIIEPSEFCFLGDKDKGSTTTTPSTTSQGATTTTPEENPDGSSATTTLPPGSNVNLNTTTVPQRAMPALDPNIIAPDREISDTGEMKTRSNTTTSLSSSDTEIKTDNSTGNLKETVAKEASKTTTVQPSSPYTILISPSPVILHSGGLMQFMVKTLADGSEVEGNYNWEINPKSSIGSSIDKSGLFSVGSNNSDINVKETIVVNDITHENSSAEATVIIKVKEPLPPGCELILNLSSATVFPGDNIIFIAESSGAKCEKGSYEWKINSKISSKISSEGIYRAGKNNTDNSAIDIIMVKDTANNTSRNAMVTVLSAEKFFQDSSGSSEKSKGKNISNKSYGSIVLITIIIVLFVGFVLYRRRRR